MACRTVEVSTRLRPRTRIAPNFEKTPGWASSSTVAVSESVLESKFRRTSVAGCPRFCRRATMVSADAWNRKRLNGPPTLRGRPSRRTVVSRMPSTPVMVSRDTRTGVTLGDPELDPRGVVGALHHGVDLHPHVPALPVEQQQADHIAPELDFVQVALLAQAQPPHPPGAGEPTRRRGGDGRPQRIGIDGPVPLEGQAQHRPLVVLSSEWK